jgi:ferredoxin
MRPCPPTRSLKEKPWPSKSSKAASTAGPARRFAPTRPIYEAAPHFLIDADKCTECVGDFVDAQCVAICPIEGAILDELGVALNPPGSLTGIPPERWAEARRRIHRNYSEVSHGNRYLP